MAATTIYIGEPWGGSFVWNDDNGTPRAEAAGSTVSGYIKNRLTCERITDVDLSWTNDTLAEGAISITEAQSALIPEGLVSELVIQIENGAFKETLYDIERDDGILGVCI